MKAKVEYAAMFLALVCLISLSGWTPEPGPSPDPKPDPAPEPKPTKFLVDAPGFHLVIVRRRDSANMTAEIVAAIQGKPVEAEAKEGGGKFKVYHDDEGAENVPAVYRRAWKVLAEDPSKLPLAYACDSRTGIEELATVTSEAALLQMIRRVRGAL